MPEWLYTIRERFTPAAADAWDSYLSFSNFKHITELVTLDSILCPDIVEDLCDEDWNHNVHEDFRTFLFRDGDYLLARQPLDSSRHQVLAVWERPSGTESIPKGYLRCGFDIMDSCFGNSTLTNCGPIPEAFDPLMVNEFGLLSDCEVAKEVCSKMRQLQPDDPHLGDCEVWLIARTLPND